MPRVVHGRATKSVDGRELFDTRVVYGSRGTSVVPKESSFMDPRADGNLSVEATLTRMGVSVV